MLLFLHVCQDPVNFCNSPCGIGVTHTNQQRLGKVFPGTGICLCGKLLISLPDESIVILCLKTVKSGLKPQHCDQIVDLGNPVLRKLLRGENPACRFVVVEGLEIFPVVEFTPCLFKQLVIILFQLSKFSCRQSFQQVRFPAYILGLPDGLVNQLFDLWIVVINLGNEIIHCR